jgi:alkylation response protein AidB-like acyl-CoA dehydrogenase
VGLGASVEPEPEIAPDPGSREGAGTMDLNLSDEQQQLVDAFGGLYAKESSTERVRAAEPLGHDADLWDRLKENGALEMAVDESAGGWGASLLDLALVAEQHGRFLGAAPLIEAQVAARLLTQLGSDAARVALESALAGRRLVTFALHPPKNGTLSLVPSGAVADDVVYLDGDDVTLAVVGDAGKGRTSVKNIGGLPLADVTISPAAPTVLASGPAAAQAFDDALTQWMVLMANALVGLAARSIEIGVDYVKERKAFGVPIGSFQAVSHGLADAATAVEGASLLAREAAWSAAADAQPERTPELAALAFGFSSDAAREASYRSEHYHGGYGFMLEYDIQLYFRRARAWPAQFGPADVAFSRGAAFRLARRDSDQGA